MDDLSTPGSGRARADRELRVAVMVALPVLVLGQVLLLSGLRWVALLGIGLPGTILGLVLARRWQAMSAR